MSRTQRTILEFLRQNQEMSLADSETLIELRILPAYYHNARKHLGAIFSRLISRGLVVRVKPGRFRLAPPPPFLRTTRAEPLAQEDLPLFAR